ncbi:MAG: hypothetical protein QXV32_02330 [Conexivisphaerales archaeon]
MTVLDEEHEELMQNIRNLIMKEESKERLLAILEPHFAKEEDFVMPLLNSLPEFVKTKAHLPSQEKLQRLARCFDMFKRDYANMKKEHKMIAEIASNIKNEEKKSKDVTESLNMLLHHATLEEEVLYPAAFVLGMYITQLHRDEAKLSKLG